MIKVTIQTFIYPHNEHQLLLAMVYGQHSKYTAVFLLAVTRHLLCLQPGKVGATVNTRQAHIFCFFPVFQLGFGDHTPQIFGL